MPGKPRDPVIAIKNFAASCLNGGLSRCALATVLAELQRRFLCERAQRIFDGSAEGSFPQFAAQDANGRCRTCVWSARSPMVIHASSRC